ncbi:hypothetical protein ACFYXH_32015 [Streptomyces sp. NPDC002730]|uniref:hypothetical protein n=1 Tax=Streptomyces sp. NPDC002730 TaxID=3364662 RepID=UPI0036C1ED35
MIFARAEDVRSAKADKTWTYADQISAGEFTGAKTSDLLVRWNDGRLTLHPGVDAAGTHSEVQLVG